MVVIGVIAVVTLVAILVFARKFLHRQDKDTMADVGVPGLAWSRAELLVNLFAALEVPIDAEGNSGGVTLEDLLVNLKKLKMTPAQVWHTRLMLTIRRLILLVCLLHPPPLIMFRFPFFL